MALEDKQDNKSLYPLVCHRKIMHLWHSVPQETVLEPSTEDEKPHTACNEDSVLSWAGLGFNGVGRMAEEIDRCRNDLVALYDRLCELVASSKLVCEKVRVELRDLFAILFY